MRCAPGTAVGVRRAFRACLTDLGVGRRQGPVDATASNGGLRRGVGLDGAVAAVLGRAAGRAVAGSPTGDRGDRVEVPDRLAVAGGARGTVRAVADGL